MHYLSIINMDHFSAGIVKFFCSINTLDELIKLSLMVAQKILNLYQDTGQTVKVYVVIWVIWRSPLLPQIILSQIIHRLFQFQNATKFSVNTRKIRYFSFCRDILVWILYCCCISGAVNIIFLWSEKVMQTNRRDSFSLISSFSYTLHTAMIHYCDLTKREVPQIL